MKRLFLCSTVFLLLISTGYSLKCYKCDATSLSEFDDECSFGRVMDKEYCPSRQGYVCSEYKFKYTVLNVTMYETARGCEKIIKGNMCEAERLEAKKFFYGMVKLSSCYICDKDLCNGVIRKRY
ncbi:uncharacterized protein LOC123315748 [Coccinella septempunctata]|uniref:uncharacterized protein LOC123315748 n=1 Tax=Coccinella septempunctata TaxID=41139 RepID=UPI001D06088F|nr:uncharacterized protein LOC123315748 [Coccinella septempunctata]